MALFLFSAPQFAMAGERCERQNYSRGYRDYDRDDYRGYENRGGYYQDYRDSGYRDYGYNGNYSNYRSDQGYYSNPGYYSNGYSDYRPYRSTGKSAAIVGGSAAAGALIGGLAGGGKGAAIGALLGGAGGFVYDRSTKNRAPRW
jgi:hypothetical protein